MNKSENTTGNVLEVKNLQVSFNTYAGEVRAVRGVDFTLREGETLAFVGESGCGKSVTSRALLRLVNPPFSDILPGSEIRFRGEDVLAMDKKRLRQYRGSDVAMIFQDPMTSLNPTMTCGKQIRESLLLHKKLSKEEARREAVRMLAKVRIPDPEAAFDKYPHQLSGGMRQRVMIAMALSCSPAVLIADEPTTALDVTIQAQILDLLEELKNEFHTAIILVTHNLSVVANYADRVQIMYAGKIVERGTVREIFHAPKHPYTRALLASIPKSSQESKEELYSLKGTPPDLILPLQYCPFADRCAYCMPVCRKYEPAASSFTDTHSLSCWLTHPQAPEVLNGMKPNVSA